MSFRPIALRFLNSPFTSFAILLLLGLSLPGCKKENDRPQWDVEVAGPLLFADIGINQLLADSLTQADANGAIRVVYEETVDNLELDSIYTIPDTSIQTLYIWSVFPYLVQPNTPFYTNDNNVRLGISGVELKKAHIRTGKIGLSIRNTLPTRIYFTYTIPKAIKNGNQFQVVQDVGPGSISAPAIFNGTYDFDGYDIDLTGASGLLVNTIAYNVRAVSDPSGSAFTVNPGDTMINLVSTLLSIEPSYVKGYLGQTTVNLSDDANVGLGNIIRDGTVEMDSARLRLDVINSIGADASAMIRNLNATNNQTSSAIALSAPGILNTRLNINRASESGNASDPVRPTTLSLSLDRSNSNLVDLLENIPDRLDYNLDLSLNPLGNVSGSNDFVYSDRLVASRLRLELPLRFAANQILLADTLDLTADNLTNLDPVGPAIVTMVAENGFPLNIELQFFLIDENGTVTDSLLQQGNLIPSAYVDGAMNVVASRSTRLEIPVEAERKSRLQSARKIGIRGRFTTPAYPVLVQFYEHYRLRIKLVAEGTYSIR